MAARKAKSLDYAGKQALGSLMEKEYVERRDEGYWIAGTRVSLDSVVFAFLDGLSPETIAAECFPVLTLEYNHFPYEQQLEDWAANRTN